MDDNDLKKVLVNDEEQYSLWPDYLTVPAGWTDTGVSGSKDECLAYVKDVWTDMRPLSLRLQMDGNPAESR
ncbi:MbtH family NRPS accessory protein [Kribbella antibiotica]|uniref:MbtH family NRPS accessory protein n=1 Tax=Kribbella antibiotica TaxID=190195 RepID=A0A4R4Z7D1_9ACTN|nr:MbtH family NRPS accessory protein [Kribbella antibiotica]TDD54181.1 MbtH family NRPS accessory protein [Kribbella antibiotica]